MRRERQQPELVAAGADQGNSPKEGYLRRPAMDKEALLKLVREGARLFNRRSGHGSDINSVRFASLVSEAVTAGVTLAEIDAIVDEVVKEPQAE